MKNLSKNIVITGASTGIGFGITQALCKRGYTVYATVRKDSDASALIDAIGAAVIPIIMDVTDEQAVAAASILIHNKIKDEGLACLINNAGIAMGGPLQHQSMEEIKQHFEVNVFGLLRTTKAFLPLLGATNNPVAQPGKIINISSVGGIIAAPFVGAYIGTKHAVEGISHSLRRELLIYGIDVIIVGPGAVKTPIWDKGIKMEKYSHTDYAKILNGFAKSAKKGGEEGLSTDYLGHQVADILEAKRPKVRYAFVPDKFKNWTIPRLLSHRALDKIIKKSFRLK
jgi:short-subunit dehydrogenase